jgi:hypothetical protein
MENELTEPTAKKVVALDCDGNWVLIKKCRSFREASIEAERLQLESGICHSITQ